MARFLKQSTAFTFRIGPFVDSTDGVSAETALTIAQGDIQISKAGGAFAQTSASPTTTHDADGWYQCPLTSTDTGTLGSLTVQIVMAGALPVWEHFMVLPANVYDSLVAGSDSLEVDATAISGDTTAANNLELDYDGTGYAKANSTIGTTTTNTDMRGTDSAALATALATAQTSLDTIVTGTPSVKYNGPYGPGVYVNSNAANTNTTTGTDGIVSNPVSTLAAARTIANAIGVKTYYILGNSDLTLAATHNDWSFIGLGETTANVVNLGSQDVDRSEFVNLCVEGTQGGSARIQCLDCCLQDPGVGDTTLHVFAIRCGFKDRIQVDASNDNIFDSCFSMVAGTATPIIQATGATGTISLRHYSGGIEFESLSASHNVSVETDGQVVFAADCNVNATVVLRGNMTITDNTAGMNNLTTGAVYDKRADIAAILVDTATTIPGTIATAQADLDTITGSDGVTLATAQANYAPATVAALATAQTDLDTLTGTDGATLATSQPNYAPATAAAVAALNDPTAASIADAVWDEAKAGHVAAGSMGEEVQAHALSSEVATAQADLDIITGADGVNLLSGTQASIDAIEADTVALTDTAIADSVPADGSLPTVRQALYMVTQFLMERAVSGTTVTVKKADGTTSLLTLTLDDATTPTSITRAT